MDIRYTSDFAWLQKKRLGTRTWRLGLSVKRQSLGCNDIGQLQCVFVCGLSAAAAAAVAVGAKATATANANAFGHIYFLITKARRTISPSATTKDNFNVNYVMLQGSRDTRWQFAFISDFSYIHFLLLLSADLFFNFFFLLLFFSFNHENFVCHVAGLVVLKKVKSVESQQRQQQQQHGKGEDASLPRLACPSLAKSSWVHSGQPIVNRIFYGHQATPGNICNKLRKLRCVYWTHTHKTSLSQVTSQRQPTGCIMF